MGYILDSPKLTVMAFINLSTACLTVYLQTIDIINFDDAQLSMAAGLFGLWCM